MVESSEKSVFAKSRLTHHESLSFAILLKLTVESYF